MENRKVALAFPELRCTFNGRSIVPDLAVFRWDRIPRSPSGKIANRFETHPDWIVEILLPGQSSIQSFETLLHCIDAGTSLGWLVCPEDAVMLAIAVDRRTHGFCDRQTLPVLDGLDLSLTPREIWDWSIIRGDRQQNPQ